MKVLKKIGRVYVAQFDCHLRPFVFQIELDNEADPQIILLLFEEANDAGVVLGNPIRVTLKLQAHTWQEMKPDHKQSWQERTLSQEFFQDKSKTVIHLILERIKAARYDEATCLSAFKMSRQDVLEGILVSYTEVMTYGEDDKDSSPIWFGYDLTVGAQRYLIDDRYCSNPQCDCGAVYLEFIEVSSPRSEPICLLLVGFDGKRMEVQACRPYPKAHAKVLLNQLLAQESELLTECQRRYHKIRQVTKRIYERQQRLPNAIIAPRPASTTRIVSLPTPLPSAKISRNSPCPCGSGKKYKQCCAGRMTVDG